MGNWARRGAWHFWPRQPVFKNGLRVSRNFFRFQEISWNPKKFLWFPRNFFEFQEIPVESQELLRFHGSSLDSKEFLPIPRMLFFLRKSNKTTRLAGAGGPGGVNIFEFQEISANSKEFLQIPRNFSELQEIPLVSKKFLRNPINSCGIPRTS